MEEKYPMIGKCSLCDSGKCYSYVISHASLSVGDCKTHDLEDFDYDGSFQEANGWCCKEGDVVEIILDIDKLELRYKIPSNADEIIAFEGIENTEYRAGIAMYNDGDAIQFISYSQDV